MDKRMGADVKGALCGSISLSLQPNLTIRYNGFYIKSGGINKVSKISKDMR